MVTTREDWRVARAAVSGVLAADVPDGRTVECVVVDDGSGPLTAQVLDSLEPEHDRVRVRHLAAPQGKGWGEPVARNAALPLTHGEVVVFLDRSAAVEPGWLGPLVRRSTEDDVLATQSVLLYPSGSIRSAGIAFPAGAARRTPSSPTSRSRTPSASTGWRSRPSTARRWPSAPRPRHGPWLRPAGSLAGRGPLPAAGRRSAPAASRWCRTRG